jgi:uncharacterized cupredoxin-like copper-binding protein
VANSLRLYRFGRHRQASQTSTAMATRRRRRRLAVAGVFPLVAVLAVVVANRTPGGSPDSSPVDRVVEMSMSEFAYAPATLTVTAGQEVRFVFHNDGATLHEAVIGDEEVQVAADHADHHAHRAAAVEVAPGATGALVYRFDEPGQVVIGCHQPGHYQSGMRAVVDVTA